MRVHHVEWHLHAVEHEPFALRNLEHVEVHARILVTGEADVAHLAGLLRCDEGFERAALFENPIRVVEAQDLVELDEVDVVRLQSRE